MFQVATTHEVSRSLLDLAARLDCVIAQDRLKVSSRSASLVLSDFAQLHLVHVWDSMLTVWGDQLSEKTVEQQVEAERAHHQAGLHGLARKLRRRIGEDACDYLSSRFHLVWGAPRRKFLILPTNSVLILVVMGTVARRDRRIDHRQYGRGDLKPHRLLGTCSQAGRFCVSGNNLNLVILSEAQIINLESENEF